jgi:hypothetical protein
MEQKNNLENEIVDKSENISDGELKQSTKKMKFWLYINALFLIIALILILVAYKLATDKTTVSSKSENNNATENLIQENKKETIRRYIDGVFVEKGHENNLPIAVMISNHKDARPTAGLAKANLVYEAEAEGGVTRYLAIFAGDDNIEKIGSIRSARPYYIDWAHEFGALYVHCGGSPEALVNISEENINDLNEFYNAPYFWRDNNRFAPHNVYTSTEKLKEYLNKKNPTSADYFQWTFKDDTELINRPESQEINIEYKIKRYEVAWKYDKQNNNYIRYLGGEVHTELSGDIVTAKNMIIEYAKGEAIDDELRMKMEDIGSGKADICFDGKCSEGTWEKKSKSARTRFYKLSGEEFNFNAGTIWIEVVRPEIKVIIK